MLSCEELGGWISQNSSQHQIDDPLIIMPLTIDNGHEAGYAKGRVLQRVLVGVVGSVPLTTSGCLSANHGRQLEDTKHTCVGSDPTTQAVLDMLKGEIA